MLRNSTGASGAILFIDVDDLKMINDSFGHRYGDEVIIKAGNQIAAETGEYSIVASFGGDEFIVLLPDEFDREKVAHVVDCIIKTLSMDYDICDSKIYFSASIGIAMYPEDGIQAEDIFDKAGMALYVVLLN